MICSLSKWLISGAADSHKAIPGFLRPHINRCAECRDFIHLSQTLEKRAADEAQTITKETPASLQEKMKVPPVEYIEQNKLARPQTRKLIPAVSFSLAVVLLVVFLVFQPSRVPSPSLGMESFFKLGKTSLPGGTLQKLASQVESPYEIEWNSLKKHVKTAAANLRAQLDLKREPKQQ